MQKVMIIAAVLALTGCATPSAVKPAVAGQAAAPVTQIEWWRTGEGLYIYHQVWGDCAGVKHLHGRNGAWGTWTLPVNGVEVGKPEMSAEDGLILNFTCTGGAACIGQEHVRNGVPLVAAHAIPFGSPDLAARLAAEFESLQAYCAKPG